MSFPIGYLFITKSIPRPIIPDSRLHLAAISCLSSFLSPQPPNAHDNIFSPPYLSSPFPVAVDRVTRLVGRQRERGSAAVLHKGLLIFRPAVHLAAHLEQGRCISALHSHLHCVCALHLGSAFVRCICALHPDLPSDARITKNRTVIMVDDASTDTRLLETEI